MPIGPETHFQPLKEPRLTVTLSEWQVDGEIWPLAESPRRFCQVPEYAGEMGRRGFEAGGDIGPESPDDLPGQQAWQHEYGPYPERINVSRSTETL